MSEREPTTPHNDDDAFEDEAFFEDGVDPELERLPAHINWFRPVLMLCVIASAVWVMAKFQVELEYFFSSSEAVDAGDLTELASAASGGTPAPDAKPDIPHNRLVRVSGLPTRVSISCDPAVRYFKLVGAPVYVELPMDDALSSIACRAKRKERTPKITEVPYYDGQGRALDFDKMGPRYSGLKQFYARAYKEPFCSDMTVAQREARAQEMRQVLREQYKEEHGDYPPDAELERLLAKETLCAKAFLIQTDKPPKTYWPYLAIFIVLSLIALWNVYLLIQWSRRTIDILKG